MEKIISCFSSFVTIWDMCLRNDSWRYGDMDECNPHFAQELFQIFVAKFEVKKAAYVLSRDNLRFLWNVHFGERKHQVAEHPIIVQVKLIAAFEHIVEC
eukprot:15365922-Ditylum_brightwellii.AAC.1